MNEENKQKKMNEQTQFEVFEMLVEILIPSVIGLKAEQERDEEHERTKNQKKNKIQKKKY